MKTLNSIRALQTADVSMSRSQSISLVDVLSVSQVSCMYSTSSPLYSTLQSKV